MNHDEQRLVGELACVHIPHAVANRDGGHVAAHAQLGVDVVEEEAETAQHEFHRALQRPRSEQCVTQQCEAANLHAALVENAVKGQKG